MKKLLALLLTLLMVASVFAGCQAPAEPPVDPVDPADPSAPVDPVEPDPQVGPDGRPIAAEQVYRTLYSSEMTTMNYLSSGTTYELEVGANTIDSLVENDTYGNIVPCAAESWETSADGLVWTFHLRAGQNWYDAEGNEMAPVTAHDYVAAARYVCDSAMDCSNSYLMDGWLVNAAEYLEYTAAKAMAVPAGTESGEDQDYRIDTDGKVFEGSGWNETTNVYDTWEEVPFCAPEDVGVVAVDDLTLEYHLVKARPYFLTVLQFGTYWPAPASLLEELGENFALDNNSMWFNGAYILEVNEPQQSRIYVRNENNWDVENIHIERIEETYNAESSTLSPEMFIRGDVDSAGIGSDIVSDWLTDPERSQMISTSRIIGDYSYFMGFNFEPTFDAEYEPENWTIAVNNENFRKTIFHALNRTDYVAARFPADAPSLHLINTVTPKGFSTYNNRDYVTYGDLAAITNTESFNEELALQFKAAALTELTAAGCTFPIKVPVNYNPSVTTAGNASVVMEQQLETLLGTDFIDVIVLEWSGTSFLNETRRNGNYAIQELNWGADFMDPETWADPFDRENSYNFFCHDTETYRVNQNTKTAETNALIDEYFALVDAARLVTDDFDARYEAFAAAEAYYINHAVVIPMFISGGSYQATKLNPFEGQYAMMGQSSSRFKGQWVYETAMSQAMFDEQYEAWTAVLAGE